MEYADFVHLARRSEQQCAEDSRAYRRRVVWFAALGYLWVVGCAALAIGILAFCLPQLISGRFRFAWVMMTLTGFGLLWVSLQALWVRIEPPEGERISRDEAPELFKALERIQHKIKGPPIHEVYLNDEFNASVRQVPRWGVFGGARNELIIGLPILMALDKRRMLAVLAHEYGHLRGDHGKLSSWVYRTRMSWSRLYDSMEDSASPFAVTTQAFLRWYSPRFVARTFAMARQDEYEADRIAAKLLGREEAGASLVETQIKSAWLNTRFWELHWAQAAREPLPLGPFRAMQRILVEAPEPVFAKETLRRAMQQLSSVDDTHPVLRERVKALGGDRASLPQQWSQQGALSLLGKAAAHWVDHFDRAWCKENADEWKRHHARLQRARARVMELQSGGPSRSVAEQVEAADLIRRLNPASSAANGLYQQALDRDPVNADALIGMVQCLMQSNPERAIQYLDRLWSNHPTHRLWAARMAVGELDTPREGREFQEQALKLWRERRREGENTEAEVVQELNRSGLMDSAMRHDLTAFELAELQAEMQRMLPVRQGWVVRRRLASLPDRKVYVVLVTLTRNEDAVQRQWCAELEQRIGLPGMMIVVPSEVAGSKEQWALFAGEPVFVRG